MTKNELQEKDTSLWLNHCCVFVLEQVKHLYCGLCRTIRKDQQQPISNGADCRELTLAVANDTQIKSDCVRGSPDDPNLPDCL